MCVFRDGGGCQSGQKSGGSCSFVEKDDNLGFLLKILFNRIGFIDATGAFWLTFSCYKIIQTLGEVERGKDINELVVLFKACQCDAVLKVK